MPKDAPLSLIEKAVMEESASILSSCSGSLIALSPDGESMDSEAFAAMIKGRAECGGITFAVGGSFGLSKELKKKADRVISFSDMTMPHQLFRIVLLEQIYRAFMIINGRTYHK